MATQVQFRRGTTTQNNAFTGAIGEITYDTEIKTLRLHDGSNAGGGAIVINNNSSQTLLNKTLSTGSSWQGNSVALSYGGTGSALTAVAGAVAYSGASGLSLTAAGTAGQILVSGGTSSPTWVSSSSISAGTSTLATTATNIAGGSAGQLVIQADTNLSTFITAGASGTFLRSAGAGYAPTWATADVTVGSTVIALGSASTTIAGLTAIDATSGATSFFATPTSPSLFAAGTAVTVGATTGTLTLRNPTVVGSATTQNLYNTVATTLNIGGAATALTLGATSGTTTVRNNLTVTGDLTINGTTTTVNAVTLTVDDKNIELGSVASPTDTTAEGGGITLKGAVDKTIIWGASTGWQTDDGFITRRAFTGTTSSTTPTAVLAIPTATYRSGELTMQVVNNTAYRILKLFFVHDGTTVTLSENYLTGGEVQTAATNTTFTATIAAGTLTLYATASSGTAVIDGDATLFKV